MKINYKSEYPGNIIYYLDIPEIRALWNTPQEYEWHPEGNVAIHTRFVTNYAARIADRENLSDRDRKVLILAALFHDIAKPDTTKFETKNDKVRIVSPGHEKAGGPITRKILTDLKIEEDIINEVIPLVENHLAHLSFMDDKKPTNRVLRRLKKRLEPSNIRMLGYLIEADVSGRPPLPPHCPPVVREIIELIEALPEELPEKKYAWTGDDLINLGMEPGPELGKLLKLLHRCEDEGGDDY